MVVLWCTLSCSVAAQQIPAVDLSDPPLSYVRNAGNYYVYNNGRDTLQLAAIVFGPAAGEQHMGRARTTVAEYVQIDGRGLQEVVFVRTYSGSTSMHGGTYDITRSIEMTIIEVWDLDRRQQLLRDTVYYNHVYNVFWVPDINAGHHRFGYEWSIDNAGTILMVPNIPLSVQRDHRQMRDTAGAASVDTTAPLPTVTYRYTRDGYKKETTPATK